ncbi:BlaI/MecI/CopY family transcriptional regulator [Niallia nealsonii]|uniref:Transcriptional regulator n=1 Tax=Niallia nealsonii TaxID=115979 RepID=A0A2N0Z1E4_9BACI|nr:BlaI/MecI/CopY family transcriptional regulator [Niallia nealsonii]PKG23334.1 transcriptional regulator [Niallia nealsonii]
MKINQFKFNEKGLNRFFGPLESKIMSILWEGEEMTIKNVQQVLEKDRVVSFNTVMTVMNRLVEKDILQKRIEGRSALYKPVLSKDVFLEKQSKDLSHELMDEFGPLFVNHMLDALEDVDQGLVEKLEQKLKDWKKEK